MGPLNTDLIVVTPSLFLAPIVASNAICIEGVCIGVHFNIKVLANKTRISCWCVFTSWSCFNFCAAPKVSPSRWNTWKLHGYLDTPTTWMTMMGSLRPCVTFIVICLLFPPVGDTVSTPSLPLFTLSLFIWHLCLKHAQLKSGQFDSCQNHLFWPSPLCLSLWETWPPIHKDTQRAVMEILHFLNQVSTETASHLTGSVSQSSGLVCIYLP